MVIIMSPEIYVEVRLSKLELTFVAKKKHIAARMEISDCGIYSRLSILSKMNIAVSKSLKETS